MFDQARLPSLIVKAQAKAAGVWSAAGMASHELRPACRQAGIRVDKEQHVTARGLGSCGELCAATTRGFDEACRLGAGDGLCVVT
jgi:hypothetical protein